MELDPVSGILLGARYVPSPNADERPAGAHPEVLIIHAISLPPGCYGGPDIERFFCNRLARDADPYYSQIAGLEVSAHFLVRRDGELVQFVPTSRRAWHAGASWCEGRARVNDFSIGIELEGTDEAPFEPVQYQRLTDLATALMRAYPVITRRRIYGHEDIAPGRKTDPGAGFNWTGFLAQLPDQTAVAA